MKRGYKKICAMVLVIAMLCVAMPVEMVYADTKGNMKAMTEKSDSVTLISKGKCGKHVDWEYYQDGTLIISGQGEMDLVSSPEYYEWGIYKDEIKKVNIENGVTSAGGYTFLECKNLEEVIFPESITDLGLLSFEGCSKLKKVKLSSTMRTIGYAAFKDCVSLEEISIPESVIDIGGSAFSGCSSLKEVNVPNGVEVLYNWTFADCTRLEKINIPYSVKKIEPYTIGYQALSEEDKLSELPTIYCYKDTKAYSYAKENGINIKLLPEVTATGITLSSKSLTLKRDEDLGFLKATLIPADTSNKAITWKSKNTKIAEIYPNGMVVPINEGTTTISATSSNGKIADCTITVKAGDKKEAIVDRGICGDYAVWILYEDGTFTVSGKGEMTNYYENYEQPSDESRRAPWYKYRSRIKEVIINDGVTNIGNFAFSGCEKIAAVQMSASVIKIGDSSFKKCDALKKISMSKNISHIGYAAFEDCSGIKDIQIPAKVEKIYASAFSGCSNLEAVEIPNGITEIRDETFKNCKNLKVIKLPDTLISIEYGAFAECNNLKEVNIPNRVEFMGTSVFEKCSSLEKVNIPNKVESIDANTFAFCSNLKEITIPDNVRYLGDSAFSNCNNLMDVTISDGVEEICEEAFYECVNLEKISIPASVTIIGDRAIGYTWNEERDEYEIVKNPPTVYCENNSAAYDYAIEEGLPYKCFGDIQEGIVAKGLCGNNLSWMLYEDGNLIINGTGKMSNWRRSDVPWYQVKSSIRKVTINDGVTSVGEWAFSDCVNIESVSMASSVTELGYNAFRGCKKLGKMDISNSITNIPYAAFQGCVNLKKINLPKNLTKIDAFAFAECSGLEQIDLPNTVTSIGELAFVSCSSLAKMSIPAGVIFMKEHAVGYMMIDKKGTDIDYSYTIGKMEQPTKIYCYKGSLAHHYAMDNELPYEFLAGNPTIPEIQPQGIKTDKLPGVMRVGDSFTIHVTVIPEYAVNKTLTWSSSNENILKVDSNGKVTAVAVGEASIIVSAFNGIKTSIHINVTDEAVVPPSIQDDIAVGEIKLNCNTLSMKLGDNPVTLNAIITPANATNKTIAWSSSNERIAKVDAQGKVTPIAVGTAVISATTNNGKNAQCSVTVTPKSTSSSSTSEKVEPIGVKLSSTILMIKEGDSPFTLSVTVEPENATNKMVTWSSSNESVATVDKYGTITPISSGTATISAKTTNGKVAGCIVTVEKRSNNDASSGVSGSKQSFQIGNTAIVVKKDASGKTTDVKVDVKQSSNVLSLGMIPQYLEMVDAATASICTTITSSSNGKAYTVTTNSKDLVAGTKLKVLEIAKNNSYKLVNTKTYIVDENGSVEVSLAGGKNYKLVKPSQAASVTNTVLKTIKPQKTSTTMKSGKTMKFRLKKSVDMGNVKKITYKSTKKSVATVSKTGKITAKKSGNAKIKATITLKNGKKKTVTMKVTVKK